MSAEGLRRLAGSACAELGAALREHRLRTWSIAEADRRGWPDPTAPSLKDFLDEFPGTQCAVGTMPYGECSATHKEAIDTLNLGGHVQMAMTAVPEVNAWMCALGDELCGGRAHHVQGTLTVSSPGAGVAWHHDSDSSLLILQLAGAKTWWITESGDDLHPERLGHTDARLAGVGGTAAQRRAIAERLDARAERIVMTPGTLTAVPPYAWHRTAAESDAESWTLLFVIQRGTYVEAEWRRMIRQPWPRELWPEVGEFDGPAVAAELEARVREYCEGALGQPSAPLVDPRTMFRLAAAARVHLSRDRGGYWTLHCGGDRGAHEQLVSKSFVPVLRWIATTPTEFSGYLARARAPALPQRHVDRMLVTLVELGVLERLDDRERRAAS